MASLPTDIFFNIMIYSSYKDGENISSIDKECYKLWTDNYFWYKKYLLPYGKRIIHN